MLNKDELLPLYIKSRTPEDKDAFEIYETEGDC
jgi:hypothetical protein